MVEQWIRAKYQREEFCHPERQGYVSGYMEGFLMKRGKEDSRYHPRKFVLSEADDTLKYHVKEVCVYDCNFMCTTSLSLRYKAHPIITTHFSKNAKAQSGICFM